MKSTINRSVFILCVTILSLCILIFLLCSHYQIYETSSIYDYGKYIGNYDNERPTAFINSFFPLELDDRFSDQEYHYKAKKFDTYSYEVYLEFRIVDKKLFNEHLEGIVSRYGPSDLFFYDNSYEEYSISNVFDIASNIETTGADTYRILDAQIGKILVSHSDQRFIYVAIGLHDGGGTDTSELCYFFNKFGIDPCEYAEKAYDTVFEEQKVFK